MNNQEKYYNGKGIYCFFPFDRLDQKNYGCFKIGNTDKNFQDRLQQYHTYFVSGVYVIGLIYIYEKKGKILPDDFKHRLNIIEQYCIDEIQKLDGVVIYNKKRKHKQGQTEFIYTKMEVIKKVFENAVKYFRQIYKDLNFSLDFVNIPATKRRLKNEYNKMISKKEKFVGELVYDLDENINKK